MSKINLKIGDTGRPRVFMALVSMGILFLSGCSQSDAPEVPPSVDIPGSIMKNV